MGYIATLELCSCGHTKAGHQSRFAKFATDGCEIESDYFSISGLCEHGLPAGNPVARKWVSVCNQGCECTGYDPTTEVEMDHMDIHYRLQAENIKRLERNLNVVLSVGYYSGLKPRIMEL
jgi:hypothetical protein